MRTTNVWALFLATTSATTIACGASSPEQETELAESTLTIEVGRCRTAIGTCTRTLQNAWCPGGDAEPTTYGPTTAVLQFVVKSDDEVVPWRVRQAPGDLALFPGQNTTLSGCPRPTDPAATRLFGGSDWTEAPSAKRATIELSTAGDGHIVHKGQGSFPWAGNNRSSRGSRLDVQKASNAWTFELVDEVYLENNPNAHACGTLTRYVCSFTAQR